MRTEDLIRELAAEAEPVARLRPLGIRVLGWIGLALVCALVVVEMVGARADLADVAWTGHFATETLLLAITALSAAAGALVLSIPGAERSALVRWLPVVTGAGLVAWIAGELGMAAASGHPTGFFGPAWACVLKTASIGIVPGIVLFGMVGRAAPLRAAWAGLLAILATSAVGVMGTNILCPNDRPLHLLLWHVAPMVLFSAAGAALGTWLLDWTRDLRARGPGAVR
ncbi:MAG: NrsF family protein [Vicinamibacterales bacterium]